MTSLMRPKRSKVVEMRRGECVTITVPKVALDSQEITVTLERKSGQHARLRIQAEDDVVINRPAPSEVEST